MSGMESSDKKYDVVASLVRLGVMLVFLAISTACIYLGWNGVVPHVLGWPALNATQSLSVVVLVLGLRSVF